MSGQKRGARSAHEPLELVPITRAEAKEFVRANHRHNERPPAADVLRVGLRVDGRLVAVGMAGTPSAPALMDGRTLEVTRLAVEGYVANACSRLYGALWRAARALGWTRMVTYTRADESGASLRAAGWAREAELPARDRVGWENRAGRQAGVPVDRVRWVVRASTAGGDSVSSLDRPGRDLAAAIRCQQCNPVPLPRALPLPTTGSRA